VTEDEEVNTMPKRRELGLACGEFTVPDDFDASLPAEVEDRFYQ